MTTRLVVARDDLAAIEAVTEEPPPLVAGAARLRVDRFGLTSNNITYGLFGEALGYWGFFPVSDTHGCIPVWGFGDVVESGCDELAVGTRLFGYFPMADQMVIVPEAVKDLTIVDGSAHRRGLNPWYNRYYLCAADPAWSPTTEPIQSVMWALFMTGWALAHDLTGPRSGGDPALATVVVSSASSKTALALAWTLRSLASSASSTVEVVGLTSPGNVAFVADTGIYDGVAVYDDIESVVAQFVGPAAFVDAAGNMEIKRRVHAAFGDRIADSIRLGAPHQGAGASTGDLVGPSPRRFFIPDVADEQAAIEGFDAYYGRFAAAWKEFVPWISGVLTVEASSGVDHIIANYEAMLNGSIGPSEAIVLGWG